MKKDDEEFFYDKNRKIKPGLTASKSLCFLVENYPKKIQKFVMSFLLNEFANEEQNIALDITSKCKSCGTPVTKAVNRGSGLCKKCKKVIPDTSKKYNSITPPRKGLLKEYAKTMLVKDIAEHYGVGNSTVVAWLKKYNIKERKHSSEDRKKFPPKEVFIEDSKVMSNIEIAEKYNVCLDTLHKWKRRYGLAKEKPSKKEFEINYGKMTSKALAEKYGVNIITISNWAKKYGLK